MVNKYFEELRFSSEFFYPLNLTCVWDVLVFIPFSVSEQFDIDRNIEKPDMVFEFLNLSIIELN